MKFSSTVTLQYDTPFSPFPASEFESSLQWLKESGFDGAEICISDYGSCDVAALKRMLDEYGLACSAISTGQAVGREGISLLQGGEPLRRTQERLRQHIDAAEILGGKVTVGLLRGVGNPDQREADSRLLVEHMAPVVEYARTCGVKILLEPINRYETSILNQAVETEVFIREELNALGDVEILWDLFHANIEDRNFYVTLSAIQNALGHIHLADSNRWFPGYGHLDFKEMLKAIQATGFSDYYSFECLNLPSAEAVKTKAGEFIKGMKEIV